MSRLFVVGWLLLGLVIGRAAPAAAQQSWARKPVSYIGGELNALPDGHHLFYQLTPVPDQDLAMFRHAAFDSVLHQRHQVAFALRGYDLHLAGHSLNQRAALYRFRRKLNDTAVTAVIDTAGKVLSFRQEARRQSLPETLISLPVSSDSLFLLCNQRNNGKGFELECLDIQQQVRWKLPFAATKGQLDLVSSWVDARYLWLVTGDNADSGLAEQTAWCLELRTGRVAARVPLDWQGTRRAVAATLLRPDHSLVLAGRAFYTEENGKHISSSRTGDLFLTQLLPDGTRPLDRVSTIQHLQQYDALTTRQVYWEQLGSDLQGRFFLLGETFGSTSAAGQVANAVALGVLTLGVVKTGFSSLTSRKIVRVQFDEQGQLSTTTRVPLPPGQSISDFGAVPAQLLAAYADAQDVFRLRGVSADGNIVVVRNKQDVSLLHLDTQQWQPLRASKSLADLGVGAVRYNHALLYYTSPVSASPRPAAEWVPLR